VVGVWVGVGVQCNCRVGVMVGLSRASRTAPDSPPAVTLLTKEIQHPKPDEQRKDTRAATAGTTEPGQLPGMAVQGGGTVTPPGAVQELPRWRSRAGSEEKHHRLRRSAGVPLEKTLFAQAIPCCAVTAGLISSTFGNIPASPGTGKRTRISQGSSRSGQRRCLPRLPPLPALHCRSASRQRQWC
jgi:hypothetical protein